MPFLRIVYLPGQSTHSPFRTTISPPCSFMPIYLDTNFLTATLITPSHYDGPLCLTLVVFHDIATVICTLKFNLKPNIGVTILTIANIENQPGRCYCMFCSISALPGTFVLLDLLFIFMRTFQFLYFIMLWYCPRRARLWNVVMELLLKRHQKKETHWPDSTSELYQPSELRLSAKLVTTLADRGCHVVSVTKTYGRILGFLGWSSYFLFRLAPQLWGWVDRVSDALFHRKSGLLDL
jgi:hypothetical protein